MVSEISSVVGKSKNLGVQVLYGGHNMPPLVEIGLIDLPKSGRVMASPSPSGTTGLEVSETFTFNVFFQEFSLHCLIENLKNNYLYTYSIVWNKPSSWKIWQKE